MKKLISLAVMAVMVLGLKTAYAATATSGAIGTSATVTAGLTLDVVLRKNDSGGAVITSMNFGGLKNIGTGTLRSSSTGSTTTGNVTAMITANSQSLPYVITQTGTAMSNGSTTLPSGACTVVPVYAAADNGGASMPSGAVLGTAGTWVATGKVLYDSENTAAAIRTIQAVYSITDDPAAGSTAGVPLNQAAGNYTGTVTITVTA